jgi:hypothetical protein
MKISAGEVQPVERAKQNDSAIRIGGVIEAHRRFRAALDPPATEHEVVLGVHRSREVGGKYGVSPLLAYALGRSETEPPKSHR